MSLAAVWVAMALAAAAPEEDLPMPRGGLALTAGLGSFEVVGRLRAGPLYLEPRLGLSARSSGRRRTPTCDGVVRRQRGAEGGVDHLVRRRAMTAVGADPTRC